MEHEQIQQKQEMINDGLRYICMNFLNFHHRQNNKGKFMEQIEKLQSIELEEKEQQFFFNINSAVLIQWLIECLSGQIEKALFNSLTDKDVIFTLLRMVQTSRLVKAQTFHSKILSQHTQIVRLMLRDCHQLYCVQSSKILSQKQQCSILSENIIKIKSIILAQRQLFRLNESELLNKIIWIDLNSLFLNILLNLKRHLKKINDDLISKVQIIQQNLKRLKVVQLYIHYLWTTNFIRTQPFINKIRSQPDSQERKKTYIYLLYQKHGLVKVSNYVQQVSFIQIKNQIDFLYQRIQEVMKQ